MNKQNRTMRIFIYIFLVFFVSTFLLAEDSISDTVSIPPNSTVSSLTLANTFFPADIIVRPRIIKRFLTFFLLPLAEPIPLPPLKIGDNFKTLDNPSVVKTETIVNTSPSNQNANSSTVNTTQNLPVGNTTKSVITNTPSTKIDAVKTDTTQANAGTSTTAQKDSSAASSAVKTDAIGKTPAQTQESKVAAAKAATQALANQNSAKTSNTTQNTASASTAKTDTAKSTTSDTSQTKTASVNAEEKTSTADATKTTITSTPASTSANNLTQKTEINRSVVVTQGKSFEIPFSGTNWIFMGEEALQDGVLYNRRRFEGDAAWFVFDANKVGNYILRFGKFDSIKNVENAELISIKVEAKTNASSTAALAVNNTSANGSANAKTDTSGSLTASTNKNTVANSETGSVAANVASSTDAKALGASLDNTSVNPSGIDPESPDGILLAAGNDYAKKNYESALKNLDYYISKYPQGSDSVFILYARIFEQNSPLRSIRKSYSYYKTIRDQFPESEYWNEAEKRMLYLERQYLEIR